MGFYIKIAWLMLSFFMMPMSLTSETIFEKIKSKLAINLPQNILSLLNENIIGKIKAEKIEYNLPNTIKIEKAELLDENGSRVIFAKQVVLKISLTSLLTKNIKITDALVEEPEFNYIIKNSIHNIIRVFDSPKPSTNGQQKKITVTIESIKVKNGQFFMHQDNELRISAEGIEANGKLIIEPGPFFVGLPHAFIKKANIEINDISLPLSNIKASELSVSDKKVSVQNLDGLYEMAKIWLKGDIDLEKKQYNLNGKIDAPKNTYPKGLKKPEVIIPALKADVYINGDLEDPQIHTQISHEQIAFQDLSFEKGQIKALITKNFLDISQLFLSINKDSNVSGQVNVDYNNPKENIKIATSLNTQNFKWQDISLPGLINIKSQFEIDPKGNLKFSKLKLFKEKELDILIKGTYYANNNIDMSVSGQVLKPHDYFSKIKDIGNFINLNAKGRIKIVGQNKNIEGNIKTDSVLIKGLKATKAQSEILLHNNSLELKNIRAIAYSGNLSGDLKMDLSKNGQIDGNLQIKKARIEEALDKNTTPKITGKVAGNVKISGQLKNPLISFNGEAKNGIIDKIKVNNALFNGNYSNDQIVLNDSTFSAQGFSIIVDKFALNLKNEQIESSGNILALNLGQVFADYTLGIDGNLVGHFTCNGTIKKPKLVAGFHAEKIKWQEFLFGDGKATLNIDKNLSLALNLLNKDASNKIQAAFSMKEKILNIKSELNYVDYNFVLDKPKKGFFYINGQLKGDITAKGKIDALNAKINLTSKNFSFNPPDAAIMEDEPLRMLGPLYLSGSLDKGLLDLKLCANINSLSNEKTCNDSMPFNLSLNGPFSFNDFSLNLSSKLNVENWANILPTLNNELINLKTNFELDGNLNKKAKSDLGYNLKLNVLSLEGNLPGFSYAGLVNPFSITFNPFKIQIIDKIIFDFSPGRLLVSGSYNNGNLDVNLNGSIPLIIARPWAPLLQRAEGLAHRNLDIFGDVDNPLFNGKIVFSPGSRLIMKKWLEPISIKKGYVAFKKQGDQSFICHLNNLSFDIGDGQASLDGSIEKFLSQPDDENTLKMKLSLWGNNILLKHEKEFAQTDFKIKADIDKNNHQSIFGSVSINNGSFSRQFDLRNFVAEAKRPVEGQGFSFSGFDSKLDINLNIKQLEASARMLNIYIDTEFEGEDLKLGGFLSKPKWKGDLMLTKGSINFPAANIDLEPSAIELNEFSNIPFDPKLELVGNTTLDKNIFPVGEDTTVKLELKGDLNKINLDLKPTSGNTSLTRLQLFLMLLSPRFGQASSEGLMKVAQDAALAVFLRPLTGELVENVAEKTQSKIQFGHSLEPGGFSLRLNWKIGNRMEFQGRYLYINEEKQQIELSENYVSDLKLILYLFDHRPLGPLSLEGIIRALREEKKVTPSAKIRLRYTILGQQ